MSTRKNTYKYHFKVGNKIVHRGVTSDLTRHEIEHKKSWPTGHIKQIGRRTTREGALRWERDGAPTW
jgi:hypothetical protein